mgnify:CR=1 FL=1
MTAYYEAFCGGVSTDENEEELTEDGIAQLDAVAASEMLNWVTLGGVMHEQGLDYELIDYVPVTRTPAGTGGGWGFAQWTKV